MIVSPLRERLRAALLLAALGAGLSEVAARTAPEKAQTREADPAAAAPAAQPLESSVCEARLDSLEHLQAEGRVEWVTWDFTADGCHPDQLYRAHFAQGFAALLLDEPAEAALHLEAAKEIGGPRDEELFYHLWTARRRQGDRPAMLALTKEFHARFPESPWLRQVLDEWKSVRRPRAMAWKAGFDSRIARSRVESLDNDMSGRLRGEIRQARGEHGFRETAALSLKGNVGSRVLEGTQLDLGAEWSWEGFTVEADWALGYDARNSKDTLVSALAGSGSGLQYAGLNSRMAQLAAGWSGQAGGRLALAARASARLLSLDWWSVGLTVTPALLLGDWTVALLLDLQHHGMSWSLSQIDSVAGTGPVSLTYALRGMQTFQASLSPSRRMGSHDLSLGLGYFLTRYASDLSFTYSGMTEAEGSTAWEHALSLSPSWRWQAGRRLRFTLGAGLGYDFEERGSSTATCREWLPGYCAEESYGADAGISVSF